MKLIEIKKTVKNGNLTVHNVPHSYPEYLDNPRDEDYILSGRVAYSLTKAFRYMLDNKIFEMEYKDLDFFDKK